MYFTNDLYNIYFKEALSKFIKSDEYARMLLLSEDESIPLTLVVEETELEESLKEIGIHKIEAQFLLYVNSNQVLTKVTLYADLIYLTYSQDLSLPYFVVIDRHEMELKPLDVINYLNDYHVTLDIDMTGLTEHINLLKISSNKYETFMKCNLLLHSNVVYCNTITNLVKVYNLNGVITTENKMYYELSHLNNISHLHNMDLSKLFKEFIEETSDIKYLKSPDGRQVEKNLIIKNNDGSLKITKDFVDMIKQRFVHLNIEGKSDSWNVF